jgi:hypothetical protein
LDVLYVKKGLAEGGLMGGGFWVEGTEILSSVIGGVFVKSDRMDVTFLRDGYGWMRGKKIGSPETDSETPMWRFMSMLSRLIWWIDRSN